jgi:hypothetical protein
MHSDFRIKPDVLLEQIAADEGGEFRTAEGCNGESSATNRNSGNRNKVKERRCREGGDAECDVPPDPNGLCAPANIDRRALANADKRNGSV